MTYLHANRFTVILFIVELIKIFSIFILNQDKSIFTIHQEENYFILN